MEGDRKSTINNTKYTKDPGIYLLMKTKKCFQNIPLIAYCRYAQSSGAFLQEKY